jgi:hypothetical protein
MPDAQGYATFDGRVYCHRCPPLGAWLAAGADLDAHARDHDREERAARARDERTRRRTATARLRLLNRLRREARR